ncbi:DUF2726 domain-containing protein [Priestia filamentosa]|uniref:DUF2726 domain-containing protein n=1 Tax=Priestia filamentosa TaxID=1402861 RepID=UPI00397CB775
MNLNNLSRLEDYISYVDKNEISEEELFEVIRHFTHNMENFRKEAHERLGEEETFKLLSFLFCNIEYFFIAHKKYGELFSKTEKEIASGENKEVPYNHKQFPHYIINRVIAAYHIDKNVCFSYIFNIFNKLSPAEFTKSILNSRAYAHHFKVDFLTFFHIVLEFNEEFANTRMKKQLVDCLLGFIVTSFLKINGKYHQDFKLYYFLFNVIADTLDSKDFRLLFIKTFELAVNKQHHFEEVPFKRKSQLATFCRTLNKKTYEEEHKSIHFHIRLYRDVLFEDFLESYFVAKESSSVSAKNMALIERHIWEISNKAKIFLTLVNNVLFNENKKYKYSWSVERFAREFVLNYYEDLLKYIYRNPTTSAQFQEDNVKIHGYIGLILSKTHKSNIKEVYERLSNIQVKGELTHYLIGVCKYLLGEKESLYNFMDSLDPNIAKELMSYVEENFEAVERVEKKLEEWERHKKATIQKKGTPVKVSSSKLPDIYFNNIDKLQRGILISLFKTLQHQNTVTVKELLENVVFNIKEEFLITNLNKLHSYGLLTLEDNVVTGIAPKIAEIISKYLERKVETKVIPAAEGNIYKPIFYHPSEMRLYRVLCEVYPQTMVFPNTSLQTVIDYDKLKELVDADTFSYYLKAHVDFIIIDTVTYLPLIAFEKDSNYNDSPESQERARMKDEIFSKSGIPLVRLRFTKANDFDQLKREILSETKGLLLEHTGKEDSFSKTFVDSIDHSKFYVE